ncbi:MAG TPA: hypothetical protein VGR23_02570, partial [Candidatus Dormibacteraeota bacterium]|nr:hypothetical protein [Candidatus Dormibacteraeota bacterium]
MLGRKNYTQEEIDQGKAAVDRQVAAYQNLVKSVASVATDKDVNSALESFEALFFNNMTLVMDRHFVHRLPGADYEGKDGNPLNEVRITCDSLMTNGGGARDMGPSARGRCRIGRPGQMHQQQTFGRGDRLPRLSRRDHGQLTRSDVGRL